MTVLAEGIRRALATPFGLAWGAVDLSGILTFWAALFIVFLAVLMYLWRPRSRLAWRRLWPLLILPILWFSIGAWAGWFWRGQDDAPSPIWVGQIPGYMWATSVAVAVLSVSLAREARIFAAAFSALFLYLSLFAWFIAAMAISGTWV